MNAWNSKSFKLKKGNFKLSSHAYALIIYSKGIVLISLNRSSKIHLHSNSSATPQSQLSKQWMEKYFLIKGIIVSYIEYINCICIPYKKNKKVRSIKF